MSEDRQGRRAEAPTAESLHGWADGHKAASGEQGRSREVYTASVEARDAHRPDCCAVVVAGGVGKRFGDPHGKQLAMLLDMPVVCWSVLAMDRAPSVSSIVVVLPKEHEKEIREALNHFLHSVHILAFAQAGATRQDSVAAGLALVPTDARLVAIHDGARPLLRSATVEAVCARIRADTSIAGAIAACRCTDTLKIVWDDVIEKTPERTRYWYAQTPQVFRREQIMGAHWAAARESYVATDDASLVEWAGGRVACVASPRDNIKVTLPEDLAIAQALMERRRAHKGLRIDQG